MDYLDGLCTTDELLLTYISLWQSFDSSSLGVPIRIACNTNGPNRRAFRSDLPNIQLRAFQSLTSHLKCP